MRHLSIPVSFRSGDVHPVARAGSHSPGPDVPVLHAANRGAVNEVQQPNHAILPSERLRMAMARVRIGDEALARVTLHRLSTSDDPGAGPIVQRAGLVSMARHTGHGGHAVNARGAATLGSPT